MGKPNIKTHLKASEIVNDLGMYFNPKMFNKLADKEFDKLVEQVHNVIDRGDEDEEYLDRDIKNK